MDPLIRNSHNFRDPYDLVIGHERLTIEFFGYQGIVNYADMHKCVSDANNDILQKMTEHEADTLMGTDPYVWSSGDTALYLNPDEQLTWSVWSFVPSALEFFITENELKGTQFAILWHELGPIGYGQLVTTREAQYSKTRTTINAFPDPYDRTVESIGLTMEFYGYQGSIFPLDMRYCIATASNEIVRHLMEGEASVKLAAPSYSYSMGEINLFLDPGEDLTWAMWAYVPIWVQEFVTENQFKGTQFILMWEGLGPVGSGHLVNTSTHVLSLP